MSISAENLNNLSTKVPLTVNDSPKEGWFKKIWIIYIEWSKPPDIYHTQRKDFAWKVKSRKTFGYLLLFLLFIQNLATYGLIIYVIVWKSDLIKDLQVILSILIPATLGETAYLVRTIVQWLFSEIDYIKNSNILGLNKEHKHEEQSK